MNGAIDRLHSSVPVDTDLAFVAKGAGDVELPAIGAMLLSILIPAYNHPAGVRRSLASLGPVAQRSDVEIIISDDSTVAAAASAIESLGHGNVVYRRNIPPLGAVANWNQLLDQARGTFCIVLHHDEYFADTSALERGLHLLHEDSSIDGLVFPCGVVTPGHPAGRNHVPRAIARWVVSHVPGYLLRRNVLGAPSVLMLRRSLYERFDTRLKWLVDVELYVRVIAMHRPRLMFPKLPGLISDGTDHESITQTLQGQMADLFERECRLVSQGPVATVRGSWLISSTPAAHIARVVESVLWGWFRILQRAWQARSRR